MYMTLAFVGLSRVNFSSFSLILVVALNSLPAMAYCRSLSAVKGVKSFVILGIIIIESCLYCWFAFRFVIKQKSLDLYCNSS